MDYDFKKNTLTGGYHVHFSMGHEVLGRWFIEELESDLHRIDALLEQLKQCKDSQRESSFIGKELTLIVQNNEVVVQCNHLFSEEEVDFSEQDMHFYDEESFSICGIEDFIQALLSWRSFIVRN